MTLSERTAQHRSTAVALTILRGEWGGAGLPHPVLLAWNAAKGAEAGLWTRVLEGSLVIDQAFATGHWMWGIGYGEDHG